MNACLTSIHISSAARRGWVRALLSARHADVANRYLVLAFAAGLLGMLLSLGMRFELATPGAAAQRFFDLMATSHGVVMVLFFAIPAMLGGLGGRMVPELIGAPDMAFPRLNAVAFWLLPPALLMVDLYLFAGDGPSAYLGGALALAGASAFATALNHVATILNMRRPGLTLHAMSLLVWSILVTSSLVLLTFAVEAGAVLALIAGDVAPDEGLLRLLGQPATFILLFPALGIFSEVVRALADRELPARLSVAYGMVASGLIGFILWAEQVFALGTAGPTVLADIDGFALATIAATLPTLIALGAWVAALRQRPLPLQPPALWAMGFAFVVIVGGAMSLVLAGSADTLGGTAFPVAQLHYAMSLAAVFAVFAGVLHRFGRAGGRHLSPALGQLHFWLTFVGVNLAFYPQHMLGQAGMPRGAAAADPQFAFWSGWSTAGALVAASGVLVFVIMLWRARPALDAIEDEAPATLQGMTVGSEAVSGS